MTWELSQVFFWLCFIGAVISLIFVALNEIAGAIKRRKYRKDVENMIFIRRVR
jgi:hypothetical protein